MKKQLLIPAILLLYLQSNSQSALYQMMPMGAVGNSSYGDTILNSYKVLKAANVSKIIAIQNNSNTDNHNSLTITEYNVNNGKIIAKRSCYSTPGKYAGFCLKDTFAYAHDGRLLYFNAMNNAGDPFVELKIEYLPNRVIRQIWVTKSGDPLKIDTNRNIYTYNSKGQVIRKEEISKVNAGINNVDASLFYNAEGQLDSIQHENPAEGTYVFTRKQKGKNIEISTETRNTFFKWVYNSSGQCISTEWTANNKLKSHGKASYYYNTDGTLSKIVEKHSPNKRNITTTYSYTK